jgi:hypothetical protein
MVPPELAFDQITVDLLVVDDQNGGELSLRRNSHLGRIVLGFHHAPFPKDSTVRLGSDCGPPPRRG